MPKTGHMFAQRVSMAFCILLLGVGFLVYGATGHDDAHITFWSANNLLANGEISNYNNERTQQSSTLLLTALIAGSHLITKVEIPTIGYALGIIASMFCCTLLLYCRNLSPTNTSPLTALLMLSSSSFLLWTYSGMESNLTAFCILLCLVFWQKWITEKQTASLFIATIVCSAALITSRPEMPLVASFVTIFLCLMNWRNIEQRPRYLQLLGMVMTISIALLLWQKFYFNAWFPLPVVAKQGGDLVSKASVGAFYWLASSLFNPMLFFAHIAALWICFRIFYISHTKSHQDTATLIAAAFMLTYSGFIWLAGGDWMQAGRFLVPIIPLAALLTVSAAGAIKNRSIVVTTLTLLCVLQFCLQYIAIARESKGIPVWSEYHIAQHHQSYSVFEQLNQEHLRDMSVIDHIAEIIPPLRNKLQRPVTLMSGQAGMVFYYTARNFGNDVAFRDLRGLVEDSLTNCPALKNLKRGQQGLYWSYKEFFNLLPQLHEDCGITAPDIIYDLNDMSRKTNIELEQLGYTLLHQETGFPVENKTRLPYNRLYAPNLLFVRNDLLPMLGNPPKRLINYRELPLQSRWPMNILNQAP